MKFLRLTFRAMGTPCELQLYGNSKLATRRVAETVLEDIDRLEKLYSRYREDSLLSRINRVAARGGEISVDQETARLLDYAQTCFEQSDGLFDVTSGLLRNAWDFKGKTLPEQSRLGTLLDRIGWQKLEWKSPLLRFPIPGMELDLGGIVKEYAVDRAASLCLERGILHGLVNLGGDIRIIGPHEDGSPWRIAIQGPDKTGHDLHYLELYRGALASSGDYERCITLDGVRYGHVLNPKTGWPVRHLAAVSVAAEFCVVAGSTATIAMLMESRGKAWLAEQGQLYYWVDVEGKTGGNLGPGSGADIQDD